MSTLQEYRQREHWSYSAINQFANICSLQFAFDRIYRLEREFTPLPLSFGSSFHRLCEWVALMRRGNQFVELEDARDLFATVWRRQLTESQNVRFDEGTDADAVCDQGMDMAECLVENIDDEERVVTVNEAFAVPLIDSEGNVLDKPLIGELDMLVEKNGERLIVDWKTSASRWPKDKCHNDLQPVAYIYAWRQLHGEDLPFRYDVIVKNKTPVMEQHTTERTQDDSLRLVHMITVIERMIAAEHFLPSQQSFYCKGCPHQGACKSWHRDRRRLVSVAA